MNLDSLSFALSQISHLVSNLTKKNLKQSSSDINHLTAVHGQEAERHLLRCLFSYIDFSNDGKFSNGKDAVQIQLLQQECASLIAKPNCESLLCFALENPLQQQKTLKPSSQLLPQISKVLKLNKLQEVVLSSALLNSSQSELRNQAEAFIKVKFPELISSFLDAEGGGRDSGLHEAPVEVLHNILIILLSADELSGITPELQQQFIAALKREFPLERAPVVLNPLLYGDKFNLSPEQLNPSSLSLPRTVMEPSLADSLREIGYGCTSDKDRCRQTLSQLGGVREVTAPAIATVLGMMARTASGLQDGMHMQTLNMPNSLWVTEQRPDGQSIQKTWNVEVFVQVVQELSPSLSWRDVVKEFDHSGFLIPNKQGLQLVVTAVRKAMHGSFPVEELLKPWQNSEGQLSWIVCALNNPDVFCFAQFTRSLVSLDMLKAPPDDDNTDIATWKSCELVDVLLKLSEQGHYQQVSELFKYPLQHCPDILVINLLQTTSPWNVLKKELLINLVPMFLGNHPNSASVLHFIWNFQGQNQGLRALVMICMAEWYMRDPVDQTRLSRILDVAQDLKALSLLLNISQFSFVVDLACLASRREYLKLDKWLSDKIREHREAFIEAVVAFLKRRCPSLLGFKEDMLHQQSNKGQLSLETIGTILAILQPCLSNIQSEELIKEITIMINNAGPLLSKPRQMQPIPPSNIMSMPPVMEPFVSGLQPSTTVGSPAKYPQQNSSSTVGLTSSAPNMSIPNLQNRLISDINRGSGSSRNLQQMPMPPSGELPTFPEEVEEEANRYFARIYLSNLSQDNLSVDGALDMLKKFKDSTNRKERDVFSCMLRNLFDENKFFPQYPERELHITAMLFGGIIEQGLVNHMALGIALKNVLDALKQEPNSKMHMFGITALDRFKGRLKDCAQYCHHIVAIPHFQSFPRHLIEYVEFGKMGQEPLGRLSQSVPTVTAPLAPAAPLVPPNSNPPAAQTSSSKTTAGVIGLPTKGKPSLAHTTNIDTLLAGADDRQEIPVPPESCQDRVFFIFNNLSQMNMTSKAEELLQALKDEFIPWAAQYLVMKRASIEPNFHPLYSSFLDNLNTKELNKRVLIETYRNIKVLLRSDKGVSNFSDRSLLKNLGHWLGLITIAKNKAIMQLDLDLKSLLYEAFHKGADELLYVVPFVAKVLESSDKSRVFKPPNPWTMSILNVLAELHQQQDLKLNLKFEIEVLCKNLRLEIQNLTAASYLSNPAYITIIECQLTPKRQEEPSTFQTETQTTNNLMSITGSRPGVVSTPEPSQPVVQGQQPAASSAVPNPAQAVPQPQYAYSDIMTSLAALAPHIIASDQIPLFVMNKQLKALVRPAIERAITDLLSPVVDKSLKLALQTCESIIKKDFALDPEEIRMRGAAHHFVRSMTAAMALTTCREPLMITIASHLKNAFLGACRNYTPQQEKYIENAAQLIAADNTELACAFIQKSAVEKAIPEIDKRLTAEFEVRQNARKQGGAYLDPAIYEYHREKMPDALRLKGGSATQQQMSVYEEFARQVPGFAASTNNSDLAFTQGSGSNKQHMNFIADEIGAIYEKISQDIDSNLRILNTMNSSSRHEQQMMALQTLQEVLKSSVQNRDISMSALNVLQKAVEGLLQGYSSNQISDPEFAQRFKECHLWVLKGLQDPRALGVQWTNKHVTRLLTECRDDYKYNEEAIECLVRQGLVNLPQYDFALTNLMDGGQNYLAVSLAMHLVQKLILDVKGANLATESDFSNTIETLAKISLHGRQAPEGLHALIEALRQQNEDGLLPGSTSGPISVMTSGVLQAKEIDDPQGLHEKAEFLLREWVTMYHSPQLFRDSSKAFHSILGQMSQQGILKSDDSVARFFKLSTEMCVELTYNALKSVGPPSSIRAKSFLTLDAFVRLIVMMVKFSGDVNNTNSKITMLQKVLGIVAGTLLQDHEVRGKEFQQLPYHRILIMLFIELNAPEHILESINFQVLQSFAQAYRIICPTKAPAFAFAWLELISHRVFIGKMLQLTPKQKCWSMYAQLLIDLFKFLAPFQRNSDLNKAMQLLYKGTLRVLLVLLHDFPEFLCDHHYVFCDVIPPNCIQMRNLILSAFPRNMRLPDPFTPNLKVDMLTEIAHSPKIVSNYPLMLQPEQLRKDLDSYLRQRSPVTFLSELRTYLQVVNDPGTRYNIPLINALVLYVGTQAINSIQNKGSSPSVNNISSCSHMDIFQTLAADLDHEGRYLFLNAIANQLRYPNSHTHYFSCALLYLFSEANSEALQEQITRVLLERLIVNRPHPWGLLVTFIELIRNPVYKFWSHEFVHCAPEIERLFESVAKSCNNNRSQSNAPISAVRDEMSSMSLN